MVKAFNTVINNLFLCFLDALLLFNALQTRYLAVESVQAWGWQSQIRHTSRRQSSALATAQGQFSAPDILCPAFPAFVSNNLPTAEEEKHCLFMAMVGKGHENAAMARQEIALTLNLAANGALARTNLGAGSLPLELVPPGVCCRRVIASIGMRSQRD